LQTTHKGSIIFVNTQILVAFCIVKVANIGYIWFFQKKAVPLQVD
jgi:hypothetical protein